MTLDDCLVVTPSSTIPKRLEDLEKARGPLPLYIGAHTKDPDKMIKLVNLEGIEAGKAFQANFCILAWTTANNADPLVNQLIINQMSIMTPGVADLISRLISGPAGGCMAHKLTVPGVSRGVGINSTTLISTHYQISSNKMQILQCGDDDYFVFFQQLHQYIYIWAASNK